MPRIRLLAVACALVLAAVGCAGSFGNDHPPPTAKPAASGEPVIGIVANTLGYGPSLGHAQSVVARAGIRMLREELSWSRIEPVRGARRWRDTDRLMAGAASRHLQLLVLLSGVPGWAATSNGGLPVRVDAYGAYVRDVVARYGPGGTFWLRHPDLEPQSAPVWFELWNEPWFAAPARSAQTATRYAALAEAGLRAGRAANPSARFLVAADTSFSGDPDVSERWLTRLDDADPGLLARADAITAHPYTATAGASIGELQHVRAALSRRGLDKPIWATEVGWSTCRSRTESCVTEPQQAGRLAAFLKGALTLARTDVAKIFVYHMHDLGSIASDREQHFGLLRLNGTRKPAWQVMHRFAAR